MKKIPLFLLGIVIAVASSLTTIAAFERSMEQPFPDMDTNAYYSDSIRSMYQMGVVTGYENGNFGPTDYVNRADLATILDRFNDKIVMGNYGEPGINLDNPETITRLTDFISMSCDMFSTLDIAKTTNSTQDTYKAICINSLQ